MSEIELHADQELPGAQIHWTNGAGVLWDFSTGWTPTVKFCADSAPYTTVLSKTSGITLAATSPNYVIEFSISDLAAIAAVVPIGSKGRLFLAYVYNKRLSDNKDLVFRPGNPLQVTIYPAPT